MSGRSQSIDSNVASPARRYNFWLGGKDNFAVDRASGDAIERLYPKVRNDAWVNRRFHARAVERLAAVEGIDQFLDIGCGIPLGDDDTHDIAQRVNPDARVVYVDHDPVVMTHVRALLPSHHAPENVGHVEADLRRPEEIIDGARATLDLSKPVAVLLVAVLHFLRDSDHPYAAVRTLMQALPARSVLVLTHASMELASAPARKAFNAVDLKDVPGAGSFTDRSKDQIERFFDGLTFLGGYPGVVPLHQWHPRYGRYPVSMPDKPAAVYGGAAWT